mmetsp:Transcript_37503/g.68549  ORF Transcript_37503/g.68549 Transcript_37503/m.68549 type:complete len:107 (+) Transcript_37503:129-449(+)
MSLGQPTLLLRGIIDGCTESLRCLGHRESEEPADQAIDTRRVPVDSTTMVPMSLYRELTEAGEAARARGQHQLQRRHSNLHCSGTDSWELDQRPQMVLRLGSNIST